MTTVTYGEAGEFVTIVNYIPFTFPTQNINYCLDPTPENPKNVIPPHFTSPAVLAISLDTLYSSVISLKS